MTEANAIHEVFPYLCVKSASEAIAFYERVFGAKLKYQLVEPSGRVGHAELSLGPIVLMLAEEFPEYGIRAPSGADSPAMSLHLHLDDCDAMARRAVEAGATLLSEPTDQFHGERSCRIRDPFGYVWLLGHEIEKVSPEEMQRRYTKLMEG